MIDLYGDALASSFKAILTMRLIKVAALLAGLIAGVGINDAHAGLYSYGSYGFSGSNVHVSDPSLGIANEYGGAGLITLNGPFSLNAYCVDLADWLLASGTYNFGVDPATDPNLAGTSSITGDSKIADISALIFNGQNSAAVQLAIWETEYGAAASFTPDDSSLQQVADQYLANATTSWTVPSNFDLYELTAADGPANQTLVYLADPPSSVREPGTLALLGGALFLVAFAGRRQHWTAAMAPG
jgi:hypothetical protein